MSQEWRDIWEVASYIVTALGLPFAILFFAWKTDRNAFSIADLIAPVVPQGLFFGRLANFINGELWGRPTDVSWAMVFPGGASSFTPIAVEAGYGGVRNSFRTRR